MIPEKKSNTYARFTDSVGGCKEVMGASQGRDPYDKTMLLLSHQPRRVHCAHIVVAMDISMLFIAKYLYVSLRVTSQL